MIKYVSNILLIFVWFWGSSQNQPDYTKLMSDPTILYGIGKAKTYDKAQTNALHDLTSKISVDVESKYTSQEGFSSENNNKPMEKVQLIVNTYSNATLKNVTPIIISNGENGKDFELFLYIKKSDVNKIFQERLERILGYLKQLPEYEKERNMESYLKYATWSLILLKSHPDCFAINTPNELGDTRIKLYDFIKQKIDNALKQISITNITKSSVENDITTYEVIFNYKKQPVSSVGYTYYVSNGTFSKLNTSKDGVGLIELFGKQTEQKQINIKIEYLYKDEAVADREFANIVDLFEYPSKDANISVSIANVNNDVVDAVYKISKPSFQEPLKTSPQKELSNNPVSIPPTASTVSPINSSQQNKTSNQTKTAQNISIQTETTATQLINKVLTNIKTKNFEAIRNNFTDEAWQEFEKIIKTGKAKIISPENNTLTVQPWNNKLLVRSIKMQFSFDNNQRNFIEDIVLTLNDSGKIERLNLGLNKTTIESIMQTGYTLPEKLTLINTMESYKSAFFLKDINFMNAIFDENAYIIVGKVLKKDPNNPSQSTIKQVRLSKADYIKGLEKAFKSNEFVNIIFEKAKVTSSGHNNIFGIQLQQNYFSSNYGDEGYLFLIMNISDPQKPIINVRTWQPLTDPEGPININNYYNYLKQ